MAAAVKTGLLKVVKRLLDLRRSFASRYQPELHYMRGPGPATRSKHDA